MKPSTGWRGSNPPSVLFGVNYFSPQAAGLEFWTPVVLARDLNVREIVHGATQNNALLGTSTTIVDDLAFGRGVNFASDFSKMVISSPSDPSLDYFKSLPQLSVAVWVRMSSFAGTLGGGAGTVVSKGNNWGTTTQPFLLGFSNSSNLRFRIVNASNSGVTLNAGGTWAVNTLYHIVATYDGANLRCYQNGVLIGTPAAQTGAIIDGSNPVNFGNQNDSADGMKGKVLDVRLYNRALSPEVIRQMYDPQTRFDLYRVIETPRYWSLAAAGPATYNEEVSLGRGESIDNATPASSASNLNIFPTPLRHQGRALSIVIRDPIVTGGIHLYDLGDSLNSYDHEKTADDNLKSITFGLRGRQVDLEEWLQYGLGRHIEIYNPGAKQIHECFVNKMTFSFGSLTIERGPLLDVVNRLSLVYTPIIDYTVDPPVLGTPTETTIAENTPSQSKYGILEDIYSAGNLINDGTINEADELRNTYLNELREPVTSQSVSTGGSREASATIECIGYKNWFGKFIYNNFNTGYCTLNTKLLAIIAADPNGIFTVANTNFSTNALLTSIEDAKNRKALSVIDEIIAQGDINDNRWFFTVGTGRKITYNSIPSTIEYYHLIADNSQMVIDLNNNVVDPWDIEAGKWISFTDTLIGRTVDTDLALDPRVMFIESVRYTAPWGFQLSGTKQGLVKQRLAKLGLGG